MELYGLMNCDTCRKALKALPRARLVDVRAEGVPEAVMQAARDRFGDRLVNRASTTWRNLDDTQRARPAGELLAEHPALMKRPLIVDGDAMWLGWTAETRSGLGLE
ncbi:ArsC/Spx/MgsR family protein [Pukyongiella litopenaei]|uniref:Arsenate reductase n=1 Tax=Pukyongiella litopenaei TaxID=2605946 RepID=A0A2S0MKX5_9RHOB|nr:ArsC/Spx/MgsR family protein [Pukyongiella litopenaei]AVO36530.1 arsenate reductase [Pukyongiella litopenaei]